MRRFSFRLENVLRIRKKQEEGTELEFAKRKTELKKIQSEIAKLGDKLHLFMRENQYSEGSFSVFDILAVDNYITRLEHDIKQLNARRDEKQQEVSRYLYLLREAKKARKVIENLRDRQLERYRDDVNREENIELDDINQNIQLNKETLTIEISPLEEF
jgi:flagellar FliJ protein